MYKDTFTSFEKKAILQQLFNDDISVESKTNIISMFKNKTKYIFDAQFTYTTESILIECMNNNSFANLISSKLISNIGTNPISFFESKHIKALYIQISELDVTGVTNNTELSMRLDEMFAAGDISIPAQGLRSEPEDFNVIMRGMIMPLFYKEIDFDKIKSLSKVKLKDVMMEPIDKQFMYIRNWVEKNGL